MRGILTFLSIGINDYPGEDADLDGCVPDVANGRACANDVMWRDAPMTPTALIDRDATAEGIRDALARLASVHDGTIWIHNGGHGSVIDTPMGKQHCWCPYDFDGSPERAITALDIGEALALMDPNVPKLLTSDSCYAGAMIDRDMRSKGFKREFRIRCYPGTPDVATRDLTMTLRGVARRLEFNVCYIAGCGPQQTCADARFDGKPEGAFSHFLWARLRQQAAARLDGRGLAVGLCNDLAEARFTQRPQAEGVVDWPILVE